MTGSGAAAKPEPGTEAGKHILIALAWNQYVAGTGKPILEDTKTGLPHLEVAAVLFPAFRKNRQSGFPPAASAWPPLQALCCVGVGTHPVHF